MLHTMKSFVLLILIAFSTALSANRSNNEVQHLQETEKSPENVQKPIDESKITLGEFWVPKSLGNSGFTNHRQDGQNSIGFWTVMERDSKSNCILLEGEINVTLFFEEDEFESNIINLSVPKEAKANGSCATLWDDFQDITLSWNDTLASNKTTNYLTLVFASNWTSEFTDDLALKKDQYALNSIEIRVMNSQNDTHETLLFTVSVSDIIEFPTPRNHSYLCNPNQIVDYKKLQLQIANFHVEAFRTSSLGPTEIFSSSVDCSIDVKKNWKLKIIMIIVWSTILCFLVALVVAFLIFRRKLKCVCTNESDGEYRILE